MSQLAPLMSALLLLLTISCSGPKVSPIITISEQDGLDRGLEYVEVQIPIISEIGPFDQLAATDTETGESIPLQVLDTIKESNRNYMLAVFPVNIKAHTKKQFHIMPSDKKEDARTTELILSQQDRSVENAYYRANFSTVNDPRGGQINGIVLKAFNDQLLKRGHIAMHWAPNFSKRDSESYFNMESFGTNTTNSIQQGKYSITKTRSGVTDSVPEIHVVGIYKFYDGLPFFEFASTMSIANNVELDLLRNDEMTMDSLFTHVMYPNSAGGFTSLQLYEPELESLEIRHIPDNALWVAFYHKEKGYGFGSIRLEYDNSNENGQPSSTYKPYTKISKATNNGRYWNRVLIGDTIMSVIKGDRYRERNAYLIFRADPSNPEKEMLYYQQRLQHPLVVTVTE